jgi:hypothetical protein
MSLMIESMESRVLLSASAGVIEGDVLRGAGALLGAKATLKSVIADAALEIKAFKTDVKGVKLTPTQKSALATLEKDEASDASKTKSAIGKILAAGISKGTQLESALKALLAHPAKTANQVKVAADLAKLQAVFSATVISTVENTASADVTVLDTDLATVATAIPSTQATVNTTQADFATDVTTLSDYATTIENAISTLATDLA